MGRPTDFKLGIRMEYTMTRIIDMHADLQPESSGWLFRSALAGAGHIEAARPLQAAELVFKQSSFASKCKDVYAAMSAHIGLRLVN